MNNFESENPVSERHAENTGICTTLSALIRERKEAHHGITFIASIL